MSHYFIDDPQLAPDERSFNYYAGSIRLSLTSDAGLFSHGHMDTATGLLLDVILPLLSEEKATLLDLGCGWGAVGVVLGKCRPALRICFVDVNPKALRYAEKNAHANGVDGEFILSDAYDVIAKRRFDYIAVNPPIHAGRELCRRMLLDSAEHLTPNGELFAVINKKHGGQSLLGEAADGYAVEILRKEKGVLVARLRPVK
ncbi:MAG: methyltransferase [Clostridium sp.]|jgi:16S rRNA (guanine1207-N2)-methyltransferase|nr:methyltransferase [Clostridium sp.]